MPLEELAQLGARGQQRRGRHDPRVARGLRRQRLGDQGREAVGRLLDQDGAGAGEEAARAHRVLERGGVAAQVGGGQARGAASPPPRRSRGAPAAPPAAPPRRALRRRHGSAAPPRPDRAARGTARRRRPSASSREGLFEPKSGPEARGRPGAGVGRRSRAPRGGRGGGGLDRGRWTSRPARRLASPARRPGRRRAAGLRHGRSAARIRAAMRSARIAASRSSASRAEAPSDTLVPVAS